MFRLILGSLIFVTIYLKVSPNIGFTKSTFRASVYEHHQVFINSSDPWESISVNLQAYSRATLIAASHGAEIIVFPESGLYSGSNRNIASAYYEYIPSPGTSNPCLESAKHVKSIITHLSCLARSYKIYVAAILGEKVNCSKVNDSNCSQDGHYNYNTQILINNHGVLIAKYHKYHLFFESANNRPDKPEIISIDTSLGRFGFIICFDILFEQPLLSLLNEEKVDTILFGASWIDELPFLNSHQVQSGISIAHNVNLLASGANRIETGTLGSGIYAAGVGPIIYSHDIHSGGSKLLIADLPKSRLVKPQSQVYTKIIKSHRKSSNGLKYSPWELKLDLFNRTLLNSKLNDSLSLCYGNVCCYLDYSIKSSDFAKSYYLIGLHWIRPTTKICEQFCGLIAYDQSNSSYAYASSTKFNYIKLYGKFSANLTMPSVVTNNLEIVEPLGWSYSQKNETAQIVIENLDKPIVGVTLYSRCEAEDKN